MHEKKQSERSLYQRRPESVKKVIDEAFEQVSQHSRSAWGLYNGLDDYRLFGVDDALIIRQIIENGLAVGQKQFAFMDLGAGNFPWSCAQAKLIMKEFKGIEGLEVTFVGLRGESNKGEVQKRTLDSCVIYEIGSAKIENLIAFLKEKELVFQYDGIFSHYTLIHLVDPLGAIEQAYNLLTPGRGMLLCDYFVGIKQLRSLFESLEVSYIFCDTGFGYNGLGAYMFNRGKEALNLGSVNYDLETEQSKTALTKVSPNVAQRNVSYTRGAAFSDSFKLTELPKVPRPSQGPKAHLTLAIPMGYGTPYKDQFKYLYQEFVPAVALSAGIVQRFEELRGVISESLERMTAEEKEEVLERFRSPEKVAKRFPSDFGSSALKMGFFANRPLPLDSKEELQYHRQVGEAVTLIAEYASSEIETASSTESAFKPK